VTALGTAIIIAFAAIGVGALFLMALDKGDDTTDWDLVVTNYAPAEVVEAQPWPQPQTVLHDKLPLDTPIRHTYIESDDDGTPLWYHEQRGTEPVYYAANLIATLRRERAGPRHSRATGAVPVLHRGVEHRRGARAGGCAMNRRLKPEDDVSLSPWRVGRHLGRTIYVVTGDGDDTGDGRNDVLLGIMDTAEVAALVVGEHNDRLSR
jgi:hypothetical protein